MRIEHSETKTYKLFDVKALDPITVFVSNYGAGRGGLVIECFGKAWSAYWGGMGEDNTLEQFFLSCNNGYIVGKMLEEKFQTDFDTINKLLEENGFDFSVSSDIEVALSAKEMSVCLGDDWMFDIPRCKSGDYHYLSRIIDAVKEAFITTAKQEEKL
jgi:hypothetical protein